MRWEPSKAVAQELSKQTRNHLRSKVRPSAARDAPDADRHTRCFRAFNRLRVSLRTERQHESLRSVAHKRFEVEVGDLWELLGGPYLLGSDAACPGGDIPGGGGSTAPGTTILHIPGCLGSQGQGGGEPAPALRAVLLGSQLVSS